MTRLQWTALGVMFLAIGLQSTGPAPSNPSFDERETLERTTAVSDAVTRTFARACNDCHSNQTNWRWYTYVAPVSWLTVAHVNHGRAELNFSIWGSYGARMRETRLRAICQLSRDGKMPLPSYVLVHPDAKLSQDEISSVCAWTAMARGSGERVSH
jgi:heme-binding protein